MLASGARGPEFDSRNPPAAVGSTEQGAIQTILFCTRCFAHLDSRPCRECLLCTSIVLFFGCCLEYPIRCYPKHTILHTLFCTLGKASQKFGRKCVTYQALPFLVSVTLLHRDLDYTWVTPRSLLNSGNRTVQVFGV